VVSAASRSDISAAYDTCLRLARAHYENFPVASRLMPADARPHIAAIYAFARIGDDFADEGAVEPAQRLASLELWQQRLDAAACGEVASTTIAQHDAVFVALAATMRQFEMHRLLSDLLSAFRQDVTTTRYDNWPALMDYCRRSANPVGRLVLLVTGNDSADRRERSDAVCTALQLTNFWQDLARDWSNGRLYVPLDVVHAHGARLDDLDQGRWSPEWRAALREAGARTRALFAAGRPVADGIGGRLSLELRATWLGGHRILDQLAAADYDVFHARPSLAWTDAARIAAGALLWRRGHVTP
jgi:squalene synthase HpnC